MIKWIQWTQWTRWNESQNWARSLVVLTLAVAPACKKDKETTSPGDPSGEAKAEPEVPDVPQEPDPPEIAQGSHLYLNGQYQEAVDLLAPLYEDLKARKQYRASGLAGSWLALAHAQLVFENAQEPATHAIAMADKTQDPEVVAAAKLAHGAYLLGNEDFQAAGSSFEAAASAAPKTSASTLAHVLRAEALIGSAFGSGASTELERPGDLEAAKQAYSRAAAAAASLTDKGLLLGRVEEGLAAIAKFQADKAAMCKHASAAIQHYRQGQASEFLLEGPTQLTVEEKCPT